jgi:hypothetical protein
MTFLVATLFGFVSERANFDGGHCSGAGMVSPITFIIAAELQFEARDGYT